MPTDASGPSASPQQRGSLGRCRTNHGCRGDGATGRDVTRTATRQPLNRLQYPPLADGGHAAIGIARRHRPLVVACVTGTRDATRGPAGRSAKGRAGKAVNRPTGQGGVAGIGLVPPDGYQHSRFPGRCRYRLRPAWHRIRRRAHRRAHRLAGGSHRRLENACSTLRDRCRRVDSLGGSHKCGKSTHR